MILRIVDWRTPLSFLAGLDLLSLILGRNPLFDLLSGSAVLGAFFYATDMVTTPTTKNGQLIFGATCGLLTKLIRYHRGEKKVWSVVHVPSVAAEDSRHLHRELTTLKADRTRHSNRIKGLLVGQGMRLAVGADFLDQLAAVRFWDGTAVPAGLRARLAREYAGWQFVDQQVKDLEAAGGRRAGWPPCRELVPA